MGCVLHLSVKLSFHRLSSGWSCAFLIFPLWKVKANKDSVPSNIISRRSLSSWPKLKLEWDSAASNIINISYCYILIYFSLSCGLAVNLYKWGLLSYIMVIIPPLLKTTSVHFDFSVSEHQNLFHHNSPSLWLANEDKKRTARLRIFTEIPPKSILSAGWVLSLWLAVGTRRKWIGWEYWREIISRIFCPQNHFSLIWL